jgi:hypothetical protein
MPFSLTIKSSSPTTSGEGIVGAAFRSRQAISGAAVPSPSRNASSSGCMKLVLMKNRPWANTGRGTIENPSPP